MHTVQEIESFSYNVDMYQYIQADPHILSGKPHVKGTRLSVEFILELFASGADRAEILQAYPHLVSASIDEVLQYAARSLRNEIVLTAEVVA